MRTRFKQHLGLKLLIILSIGLVACTVTPNINYNADSAVPVSVVDDLQFSDTSSLAIQDCVDKFMVLAEPIAVVEGDVLASDFIIYIDFADVYMSWHDFPLEALCVKANWGVFRTTGIMQIPTDGQVWSINLES